MANEGTGTGTAGSDAGKGAEGAAGKGAAADAGKGAAGEAGKGAAGGEGGAKGSEGAGAGGDAGKGAAGTGDGKGGDAGKGGEGKGGEGTGAGKAGAPEKYSLKLSQGSRLEESDLKYVEKIAREAGLSNEDAAAVLAEQEARVAAQADEWLDQTKADKEYGGDNLATSQTRAKAVIDRIRPAGHPRRESFMRFLNRGGAGNHVEVIGFLADLGKQMAEDTTVTGAGGGGDKPSAAERLYNRK